MSEPLDEQYFGWLYNLVGDRASTRIRNQSRWELLKILYTKEFVWHVPNDDNRAEDGLLIRGEFFVEINRLDREIENWMLLGCSMLEMMIGLSRRLEFETDISFRTWFWTLMSNLNLDRYYDARPNPRDVIDEILDQVIWRTYNPSGKGGLFPLKHTRNDQRKKEIWYQMSEYLLEQGYY